MENAIARIPDIGMHTLGFTFQVSKDEFITFAKDYDGGQGTKEWMGFRYNATDGASTELDNTKITNVSWDLFRN